MELHQQRLHLPQRIGLRFYPYPQRHAVRHPAVLSKHRFRADADDLGRDGGIRFVRLPRAGSSELRIGWRRTGDRRDGSVDLAGLRVHHRSMGRLCLSAGVSRGRNAHAAIPQHHPRGRRRHGHRRHQAEPSRPHRIELRPARRLCHGEPRRLGRPGEVWVRHGHPLRGQHLHRRHDHRRRRARAGERGGPRRHRDDQLRRRHAPVFRKQYDRLFRPFLHGCQSGLQRRHQWPERHLRLNAWKFRRLAEEVRCRHAHAHRHQHLHRRHHRCQQSL